MAVLCGQSVSSQPEVQKDIGCLRIRICDGPSQLNSSSGAGRKCATRVLLKVHHTTDGGGPFCSGQKRRRMEVQINTTCSHRHTTRRRRKYTTRTNLMNTYFSLPDRTAQERQAGAQHCWHLGGAGGVFRSCLESNMEGSD